MDGQAFRLINTVTHFQRKQKHFAIAWIQIFHTLGGFLSWTCHCLFISKTLCSPLDESNCKWCNFFGCVCVCLYPRSTYRHFLAKSVITSSPPALWLHFVSRQGCQPMCASFFICSCPPPPPDCIKQTHTPKVTGNAYAVPKVCSQGMSQARCNFYTSATTHQSKDRSIYLKSTLLLYVLIQVFLLLSILFIHPFFH